MFLHTPVYLGFLGAAWILNQAIGHRQRRKLVLLVLSGLFYLSFDWRFAGLLLVLTAVTYLLGRAIAAGRWPRLMAWMSTIFSLGMLGAFKYAGFFVSSAIAALEGLGLKVQSPSLTLILPIGISFYTFQAIAYTTELYRKRMEPAATFVDFALYMAFFPKIIAGPLLRPASFLRQLESLPQHPDRERTAPALRLLLLGLVKKVLIADSLGAVADVAFRAAGQASTGASFPAPLYFQGFYLYAFQIYADFSGYTDIARASAALLGFELPENFQQPYFAPTVATFWNRWHMTLTQWFREYLYFPMTRSLLSGMGRRAPRLVQVAVTLTTMGLIGLWHGAAWTYVVWGLWHGVLLSFERILNIKPNGRWISFVGCLVTFHLVGVGWVLFRAESFGTAARYLSGMAAFGQMNELMIYLPPVLLSAALVLGIDWAASGHYALPQRRWIPVLTIAAVVVLVCLWILDAARGTEVRPFIYAQF